MLSLRTEYYASLTHLILMDNIPGRMELFITPFSTLLQKLLSENFTTNNVSVRVVAGIDP